MLHAEPVLRLSAEPILSAIDSYRGTFIDLDRDLITNAQSFATGRSWLTRRFREAGLQPGDRVVVAVGNGPMFPATLAGILAMGGTPLLVHFESPPAELLRTAERVGARFMICDPRKVSQFDGLPAVVKPFSDDHWVQGLWIERLKQERVSDPEPCHELSGVLLHPTSGTTGEPKLAARPASAAVAEATHYIEAMGIDDQDTLLCPVPMSHAYGFGVVNMVSMLTGADVVSMRKFQPKLTARALKDYPITILPGVPVMLDLLAMTIRQPLENPPRYVTAGGAPLTERIVEHFRSKTGTTIRSTCGTTETGAISIGGPGDPCGCIGQPLSGVEAQIQPVENADGLAPGVGRLRIKSTSLMAGYLSGNTIDSASIDDGWFETGDLALIDENGAIHLMGRQKEVINVFGLKVFPLEVEDVISTLPSVKEVKVYPGVHSTGSQIVKAAVVTDSPMQSREIRQHCQIHLASYKLPESITILDKLPRTPSGKVILNELP